MNRTGTKLLKALVFQFEVVEKSKHSMDSFSSDVLMYFKKRLNNKNESPDDDILMVVLLESHEKLLGLHQFS